MVRQETKGQRGKHVTKAKGEVDDKKGSKQAEKNEGIKNNYFFTLYVSPSYLQHKREKSKKPQNIRKELVFFIAKINLSILNIS